MTEQPLHSAEELFSAMRRCFQKSVTPLVDRVAALEKVEPQRGEKGQDGAKGDKGDSGEDGKGVDESEVAKLVDSVVAKAVAATPIPKDGKDGLDGKNGLNGEDGKSIDESQLAKLIDLAVAKAISAIPIPKDGKDGRDGSDGKSVDEASVLATLKAFVESEVKSIPVPRDGRDGLQGEPGRDALQIDVLESVDEAKRYQRNTYASYKGGLIRSFRATDPITNDGIEKAGWHIVVDGLQKTEISHQDGSFTLSVLTTSGKAEQTTVDLPVMTYKGIWREGSYRRGNTVTWGGCLWHCNDATTEKPRTESKSWTLAVKHGLDGKDGLPGQRGQKGEPGRNGKDWNS